MEYNERRDIVSDQRDVEHTKPLFEAEDLFKPETEDRSFIEHSDSPGWPSPAADLIAWLAAQSREIAWDATPVVPKQVAVHALKRRLSPEMREEIVARYLSGENSLPLSRAFGVSKTGLLDLLRREGVELRRRPITESDARRAARLYESGMSISEVVDQIGYSFSTVRRALHQRGVVIRPKGIKRSSIREK
jgi:transposase-like protein